MLQARQSNTSHGGHQQAVSQLIQAVLNEGTLGAAYGQHLVKIVERSAEQDASDSAIGALPSLVCEVSGGNPGRAGPVTITWQLLRLAAKLFDDVEDGEVSCLFAEAINLATGLIFLAELSLAELLQHNVPPDRVERLAQALNRAWLWACAGQQADLAVGRRCAQRPNLAVCYALSVTKAEERARLEALLAQAAQGDSTSEAHARQLLTDLGAQGYLLVVAQVQHQQAIAALRDANCLSPRLTAVLDQVLPALSCARK